MKFWTLKIFVGHVTFVMEIFLLSMYLWNGEFLLGMRSLAMDNFVGHVILVMGNFVRACSFCSWKILLRHVIFGCGKFCWGM